MPEGERFLLLHGSTVATNALLERRGARVVLVTNEGFEDVIEIGRQNRPQLYALVGHRPPPLVARDDRIGVPGRLGPRGEEVQPLDPAVLEALATLVEERDAQAVAVCLLHAYANPAHERAVATRWRATGLPLSISSELLPEFREYERTSTTVVNAYVAPVMSRYLGRLSDEAGAERVTIMGSNGGALPVERARREPVHTVLSGPAGGVVGALAWARRAGHDRVLSFDMGGTSTDVSLCPGRGAPHPGVRHRRPARGHPGHRHPHGGGGGRLPGPPGRRRRAARRAPERRGRSGPDLPMDAAAPASPSPTRTSGWAACPWTRSWAAKAAWIAKRCGPLSRRWPTASADPWRRPPKGCWRWPTPPWSARCG